MQCLAVKIIQSESHRFFRDKDQRISTKAFWNDLAEFASRWV